MATNPRPDDVSRDDVSRRDPERDALRDDAIERRSVVANDRTEVRADRSEQRADQRASTPPTPLRRSTDLGAGARDDRFPSRGAVVQESTLIAPRDAVRWGPVVAGLVTAVSLFLLLSLLALGLGIAATQAVDPNQEQAIALGSGIVAAVIGLVAFFVGGLVAGRGSAVAGRGVGAFNGFLVWGLGLVLILWLAASGVGAVLGAAGDIVSALPPGTIDPAQAGDVQVNPEQAAATTRDSALIGFVSLGLPALAAAIGGAVGARSRRDVDPAPGY